MTKNTHLMIFALCVALTISYWVFEFFLKDLIQLNANNLYGFIGLIIAYETWKTFYIISQK